MYRSNDVTISISCFNTPSAELETVLDGIFAQTEKPARIMVVDDASTIPVRTRHNGIDWIRNPENIGLGASRNLAVRECTTPLIAALDSDAVPDAKWLERLLRTINNGDFAGVGGKLVEANTDGPGNRWRSIHMAQHWGNESLENPRFLYGCNTLFRRDILLEHGYDPKLRTNYEDMELCHRLYDAGFRLAYEPSALCRHLRRDTEISILPGFWKWFHGRGVVEGQFTSEERLLDRMDRVNFGIFRYRFDLDVREGRNDLLLLDSLIPWVFCLLDLEFAADRYGIPAIDFPGNDLADRLAPDAKRIFVEIQSRYAKRITGAHRTRNEKSPHPHPYIESFNVNLEKWKWTLAEKIPGA